VDNRRIRSQGEGTNTEVLPMIEIGSKAPDFTLASHLGPKVSLEQFRGKRHVLLLFYPLDFTPT